MAILSLLLILCLSVSGRTWHNFNGFQYSIEMITVTSYVEAEMGCSALQANVAYVKTTAIFDFLKSYINLTNVPYSVYIGARRKKGTKNFQWNDGSDFTVPKDMWDLNQPNNQGAIEDCVTMGYAYILVSTYKLHDAVCRGYKARYICEKKTDRKPHTPTVPTPSTVKMLPSSKPSASTMSSSARSTSLTVSTVSIGSRSAPVYEATRAPPKPNTAVIASTVGGCVILVIICIAIVVVTSWKKRRRNEAVNVAVAIEYNANVDVFQPEETYNIPQATQPSSHHQNDDVIHYDGIQEPRHVNMIVDEVAQSGARSSDVYAQVRKPKQSTNVHDNGQQSHVRKYGHNQLDEVSYDTLQLYQRVEVHDQFASGSNPTNIYDNRHGANDESDSPYDELRRYN